jgi:hypothetical protein
VADLVNVWFAEAGKYDVLPLDDRSALDILLAERPSAAPQSGTYVYYPDTTEVPERNAASVIGRSYRILAQVEIDDPNAEGVLFAQGSRFGGHSLFVKDRSLHYVYNFIGIPPEQKLVSNGLKPGRYVLGVEFEKSAKPGQHGESHGTARLYINQKAVASTKLRTMAGHFSLCGEGLCVGRDSGDSVSGEYSGQFPFSGGTIRQVEVNVGGDQYVDMERAAAAMMARE